MQKIHQNPTEFIYHEVRLILSLCAQESDTALALVIQGPNSAILIIPPSINTHHVSVLLGHTFYVYVMFMHLADAFIQSDLQVGS